MQLLDSILLGILQGVTEFFPVSSSGHLFLAQEFFSLKPDLNFEIWLHGASLLAVLIFFRDAIIEIIKKTFTTPKSAKGQLGYKLLVSTACTVPVALFIEPYFEDFLSVKTVALMLLFTALLILTAEKFRTGQTIFSWKMAVALGFFQGLAVIPGISRSGLTIAVLILLGINRKLAVEISFLLAIPTIAGAIVFSFSDTDITEILFSYHFMTGFVFSFIASMLSIKWMLDLIQGKWVWFAWYCMVIGGGVLIIN